MRYFNKVTSMVLFCALLLTLLVGSAFASKGEALDPDGNDIESLEAESETKTVTETETESKTIPDPEVPLAAPPIGETSESQSGPNHTLFYMIIGGIAIIIIETFTPTIIAKIRKTTK